MYEHRCAKWLLWEMSVRSPTDVAEGLKSAGRTAHFTTFCFCYYSRSTRIRTLGIAYSVATLILTEEWPDDVMTTHQHEEIPE